MRPSIISSSLSCSLLLLLKEGPEIRTFPSFDAAKVSPLSCLCATFTSVFPGHLSSSSCVSGSAEREKKRERSISKQQRTAFRIQGCKNSSRTRSLSIPEKATTTDNDDDDDG